jgi:drug/metabolite transporter (DMT)-like permease
MNTQAKGAWLMCGASVAYCVMSSLIRMDAGMSPYITAFFRFSIGLGLLGALAVSGGIKLKFVRHPLLIFRGVAGAVAVFIWFFSIQSLGLGKGTVIFYTYPVFAGLFSAFFLKERAHPIKWAASAASLLGVFLLVMGADIANPSLYRMGLNEIIALSGAITGGLAVVSIKKLVDTDSSVSIYFAQCLAGFWLFMAPAHLSGASSGYHGFFLLVLIGLTATAGQLLMTEGYRRLPVATGAPLVMLVPVLNLLAGMTFFNEPFSPAEISGAAIVVASCCLLAFYDARKKPAKT